MKQYAAVILSIVLLNFFSVAYAQNQFKSVRIMIGGGSAFVSDVTIPDGTEMVSGQSFTKTWKLKNTGKISWDKYKLIFVSGEQMDASSSVSVPITAPGETVDISVQMTAPKDAGSHQGSWQMSTADEHLFGQEVFVLINVKSSVYKERTFENWETDLHSQSPSIREETIKGISRFGQRAAPPLIKIYRNDPDEKIRVLALAALGGIMPPSSDAIRVFLEAAANPAPTINFTAMTIFYQVLPSKITTEALPTLIEALHFMMPIQ